MVYFIYYISAFLTWVMIVLNYILLCIHNKVGSGHPFICSLGISHSLYLSLFFFFVVSVYQSWCSFLLNIVHTIPIICVYSMFSMSAIVIKVALDTLTYCMCVVQCTMYITRSYQPCIYPVFMSFSCPFHFLYSVIVLTLLPSTFYKNNMFMVVMR